MRYTFIIHVYKTRYGGRAVSSGMASIPLCDKYLGRRFRKRANSKYVQSVVASRVPI